MQRSIIHQWRDWLLEYIGGDNYELTNKDTLEVFAIVANTLCVNVSETPTP